MTGRDWRAGELRLLAMALVIAVAAVTSVGFFVDRLRLGLERDAAQLLAADLVLSSDQPISDALRARARSAQLQTAETVTFPSMALNAANLDRNALAAVKAVSPGYPLQRCGSASKPATRMRRRARFRSRARSGSIRSCCRQSARTPVTR
jgi:putative ABC transport system permease protein